MPENGSITGFGCSSDRPTRTVTECLLVLGVRCSRHQEQRNSGYDGAGAHLPFSAIGRHGLLFRVNFPVSLLNRMVGYGVLFPVL